MRDIITTLLLLLTLLKRLRLDYAGCTFTASSIVTTPDTCNEAHWSQAAEIAVQLTTSTPLLTHKHTHSHTFIHTRGPSDVSRGDFPCHMRAWDRHKKCCVIVWLYRLSAPHFSCLSLFDSLCFCASVCLLLSVRFASIYFVFARLPELSLTLSCLSEVSNSAALSRSHIFGVSHIVTHCLAALFCFSLISRLTKADQWQFFLRGNRNASRQRYPIADLDKTISSWHLWLCSVLWQVCALIFLFKGSTRLSWSLTQSKHYEFRLPEYDRYVILTETVKET